MSWQWRRARETPTGLIPGPRDPHLNKKLPRHISTRPDLYIGTGRTLVEPQRVAQKGRQLLRELATPQAGSSRSTGSNTPAAENADDEEWFDIPGQSYSPFSAGVTVPSAHAQKRAVQWDRWQQVVLPKVQPVYIQLLHDSKSLRNLDGLALEHAWSCIEDVTITAKTCDCGSAAQQLLRLGAFPCAPLLPTLAVDLRVLEFAATLFLRVSPNNSAFSSTLETVLSGMGYRLDGQDSLRRRFGNALQWYIQLKDQTRDYFRKKLDAFRPEIVASISPSETDDTVHESVSGSVADGDSETVDETVGEAVPTIADSEIPSSPPSPSPIRENGKKRARASDSDTDEGEPSVTKSPFPGPMPRARPTEWLRSSLYG
ncbi:hypothetical protein HMN09_00784600 [Mycena chlorophos]|uniref:CxC1-like cysteine cluster associated with KDZ transposases domain-containing protein n=1 Tax=Mycena chlorophos TaxID=658473 RepID=A0A8H6W8A4_MYCCL|nr:hypothetical protein HMN09_00784600 [Mycena chlorophos]